MMSIEEHPWLFSGHFSLSAALGQLDVYGTAVLAQPCANQKVLVRFELASSCMNAVTHAAISFFFWDELITSANFVGN
jgi:hypothetical protein